MRKNALMLVLAAGLGGCAAAPQTSSEPSADKGEIVTGSNIPRKSKQAGTSKVDEMTREELERSRILTMPPQAPGAASRGGA